MSGLVYVNAPITVIAEAQDYLANNLAKYLGPWEAEIKLYRANPASFAGTPTQGAALYTVALSHYKDKRLYVHTPQESVRTDKSMTEILESKLQSVWQLRQTFKAEGQQYEYRNGEHVRIANVFIQGNYKGLLIELNSNYEDADEIKKFETQITEMLGACGLSLGLLGDQISLKPGMSDLEQSKLYERLST